MNSNIKKWKTNHHSLTIIKSFSLLPIGRNIRSWRIIINCTTESFMLKLLSLVLSKIILKTEDIGKNHLSMNENHSPHGNNNAKLVKNSIFGWFIHLPKKITTMYPEAEPLSSWDNWFVRIESATDDAANNEPLLPAANVFPICIKIEFFYSLLKFIVSSKAIN